MSGEQREPRTAVVYINGVQVGTAELHLDAEGVLTLSRFDPALMALPDEPPPRMPAMSFSFTTEPNAEVVDQIERNLRWIRERYDPDLPLAGPGFPEGK